jgi:predicted amidohydrolase
MRRAKELGADVLHTSECALSGYAGTDFPSFEGYDWDLLTDQTRETMALAAELQLWLMLGSTHRLTEPNKPHNSLYLISPEGKIVDRYDKRFCTVGDLRRLTPGDHFVFFTINGVKCSILICFDLRFPEVYRELYKAGVRCVFQSFYNARQKGSSVHKDIMRQSMQCRAATNNLWASMANASGWYAPYPSCFIRPDGKIVQQLSLNRPGIMVNTVNLSQRFYDPMADFRDMAMAGRLDNAPKPIEDSRSGRRDIL